jgi:Transposase DDE domain
MPSTTSEKERALERATVSNRYGAGDSPSGEATAPPPGILERLPDEMRERLPDELVDELLAGARTEEEIFGQGGLFNQLTKITIEPVFGQIKHNRHIERFMRRGRSAAHSEWRLVTATHNLLKLHNHWIANTA